MRRPVWSREALINKHKVIKDLLNRITPDTYEEIVQSILAVGYETQETLVSLADQVFDKALAETCYCKSYAELCCQLNAKLPSFEPEMKSGRKSLNTFREHLLNRCQEEFQQRARHCESGSKEEQNTTQDQATQELNLTRFIGYLYCNKMITEKRIHECVKALLAPKVTAPSMLDLECAATLLSIAGHMLEKEGIAAMYMDAYFERIKMLIKHENLDNRTRLMLQADSSRS